jgi:hypothetical protein
MSKSFSISQKVQNFHSVSIILSLPPSTGTYRSREPSLWPSSEEFKRKIKRKITGSEEISMFSCLEIQE